MDEPDEGVSRTIKWGGKYYNKMSVYEVLEENEGIQSIGRKWGSKY